MQLKNKIKMMCLALCFAFTFLSAQELYTPLQIKNFEKVTTHQELLNYLAELDSFSSSISMEMIGKSVQNREIPMIFYSGNSADRHIKVLIFAQQHGNEPSGKEAALMLIRKLAIDTNRELFPNIDLYIIPSSNPDGNESSKRSNANKSDVNRDHLLLTQPEVIAIHNQFNKIFPEVTLDVHEYSAFRKSFLAVGYVRATEEEFGAPTNLNVPKSIVEYGVDSLFSFLNAELTNSGVSFSNYHKINGPADTVRASTAGIIDGRQSFAILNSFSFLVEGQNGKSFNSGLERRSLNQLKALESFIEFQNKNYIKIISIVDEARENSLTLSDSVVIQMDYNFNGEKIELPVSILPSMKDSVVSMLYSSEIKGIKSVARPKAYLIPSEQADVIELLKKHNVDYSVVENPEQIEIEVYKIKSVNKKWLENKIFTIAETEINPKNYTCKTGDVIVSVNQNAGTWLSIALEPESMWGIIQSDEFKGLLKIDETFPIYRIMKN